MYDIVVITFLDSNCCCTTSQGPPVDWTDLPADLVAAICKSLYFRAVCKKWRTATSISDLPPQFPWVLGRSQDPKHLHLYSLITGITRTICCPKASGKLLRGPSHRYLYATVPASERPINFLLNPLTNDEVHFKPERDLPGRMVCMNNYIAFKWNSYDQEMSFFLPHNGEWYHVRLPVTRFHWRSACLNGSYYLFGSDTGNTVVVDIARGSSFSVPPPDNLNFSYPVYFVESAGKILSIAMQKDLSSVSSNFYYSFNSYHLDVLNKNCGIDG